MDNLFSLVITNFLSTVGWIFNKTISLFSRDESLISKEAVELLSNPTTREDFINFTSGNQKADKPQDEAKSSTKTKTFPLKNGESITLVNYS